MASYRGNPPNPPNPPNPDMDITPDFSKSLTDGHALIENYDLIKLESKRKLDYRSDLLSLYNESGYDNHFGNLLKIILSNGGKILFIDGNNISQNDMFINQVKLISQRIESPLIKNIGRDLTTREKLSENKVERSMIINNVSKETIRFPESPMLNKNKAENLFGLFEIMLSTPINKIQTVVLFCHDNIGNALKNVFSKKKIYAPEVYVFKTNMGHTIKVSNIKLIKQTNSITVILVSIETPGDGGSELDDYLLMSLTMATNNILNDDIRYYDDIFTQSDSGFNEKLFNKLLNMYDEHLQVYDTSIIKPLSSISDGLDKEIARVKEMFSEQIKISPNNFTFQLVYLLRSLGEYKKKIEDLVSSISNYKLEEKSIRDLLEKNKNIIMLNITDIIVSLTPQIFQNDEINKHIYEKKNIINNVKNTCDNIKQTITILLKLYYDIYSNIHYNPDYQNNYINYLNHTNYETFIMDYNKLIQDTGNTYIDGMMISYKTINSIIDTIDMHTGYYSNLARFKHEFHLKFLHDRIKHNKKIYGEERICKYLSADGYEWLRKFDVSTYSSEFKNILNKIVGGLIIGETVIDVFSGERKNRLTRAIPGLNVAGFPMNTAGGGRVKKTKIKMRRRLNKTRIMKSKTKKH